MADDPRADLLRQVQLMAQGYLIDFLLATQFAHHPHPAGAADQLLRMVEASVKPLAFPGLEPDLAEFAAQEYRKTLVGHIQRARSLATGEPFNPEAFPKPTPPRAH